MKETVWIHNEAELSKREFAKLAASAAYTLGGPANPDNAKYRVEADALERRKLIPAFTLGFAATEEGLEFWRNAQMVERVA